MHDMHMAANIRERLTLYLFHSGCSKRAARSADAGYGHKLQATDCELSYIHAYINSWLFDMNGQTKGD